MLFKDVGPLGYFLLCGAQNFNKLLFRRDDRVFYKNYKIIPSENLINIIFEW